MSADSSPATDAAAVLLARLVARGVRDVVLSPGSRSQALALVASRLAERGAVRLHVRIDERVAGFTALGIGRETGVPAVLVCTSGTAVANYLPAVLEAHHAGIPLLVLSADRPPELRGVGANQVTVQPGLFGTAVRYAADLPVPADADPSGGSAASTALRAVVDAAFAAAVSAGPEPAGSVPDDRHPVAGRVHRVPGPVHLNVPYREPLAGPLPDWIDEPIAAELPVATRPEAVTLGLGPRTVVVAGADAGPLAEEIAFRGSWPLIAEVVSGSRFGRQLVHGYRAHLRDPELGGRIERVVVLGHPTLSREVAGLLARTDLDVVAVRSGGEPLDLNHATRAVDAVEVGRGTPDRTWLGEWMRASRDAAIDLSPPAPDADGLASAAPRERLGALAAELGVIRAPIDRAALVDAVWRASWPHDRLVFGASRLVRVADEVLGGKKLTVHSNRGLAGIDGTVATALGIAIVSQAAGTPGVTRVLLGDLALLHDVGALLLPADEPRPRIQVVVGNDGGGTIFDTLEVAEAAPREVFDRVFHTPQSVDLERLAAAYGWEYHRVTTRVALDQVLTSPVAGCQLIDVALPR